MGGIILFALPISQRIIENQEFCSGESHDIFVSVWPWVRENALRFVSLNDLWHMKLLLKVSALFPVVSKVSSKPLIH